MKRLLLVRHGESEWNASRRLQGQADIGLSALGEDQARALRATIAVLDPGRVVASSLRRARETATLLGYPEAEPLDAFREIDVGDWTGAAVGDLQVRDQTAYRCWRAGTYTPPGGEPWESFRTRTGNAVRALLDGEHSQILVVSHGGVVRALLDGLLAISPERIVPVAPGSLSLLQQNETNGREAFRLELFNFSPGGPVLDAPD